MNILTPRFADALHYAFRLHSGQKRKNLETPYFAHLMGVASLVLEAGGDEDQAIAALLHDAVEDQGGLPTLEAIRQRYGDRVAEIVDHCTDAYVIPKPPWRKRKEQYLIRLHHAPPDARLVSLADKLYNVRTILVALRTIGDETWKRFKGGREGTLWYYRALLEVFRQTGSDWVTDELEEAITEMEQFRPEAYA
jgi:(p)ppGpp synthase/HD superfamily hydrolase